jgi:hypothetical protein
MTVPSDMRDLARHLLGCDAIPRETSAPAEAAIFRVYEKLRQSLCILAGVDAFQSLAVRALTLARSDAPALCSLQVAVDGSLQRLGESEAQPDSGIDLGSDAEVILVARLLGLLQILLGENLTLRLLQNSWPAASDDCNRKVGEEREHTG